MQTICGYVWTKFSLETLSKQLSSYLLLFLLQGVFVTQRR